jgi:hypothetical protein
MNKFAQNSTKVILRLVLYRDEAYRLPRACRGIRVRSGVVWVTFTGKDIILGCGEETYVTSGKDFVVVSAVGHTPLVLEILGDTHQRSFSISSRVVDPTLGNCPDSFASRAN